MVWHIYSKVWSGRNRTSIASVAVDRFGLYADYKNYISLIDN